MKTTILRANAPALFLAILTPPVLLRALAEINPDHFDTPNGAAATNADRAQSIEINVTSRSNTHAPTALLAERTGRQRALRGICFAAPAIMLPLPTGKKAATLRNTEALPVSSSGRVFSPGDGS